MRYVNQSIRPTMKLRIKGDTLRLRVTQGELATLSAVGIVEDRIHFGAGQVLTYRLRVDARAEQLGASLAGDTIEVRVPAPAAREWSQTDLVTLAATQPLPQGDLKIVVEKDWACLAPREGEDESDQFPHPEVSAKSC
jgi:hypothetical protein